MSSGRRDERVRALLIDRAIGELSAHGERELARLGAANRDLGPDPYEIAAAAAHLAFVSGELEALPASLRRRITRSARSVLGGSSNRSEG